MRRLPRIRTDDRVREEREMLARWLHEWRLDCLFRDEPICGGSPVTSCAEGDETTLAAGQIRLVRPVTSETASALRYIALLQKCDWNTWLVAPFSRFSTPATPWELESGHDSLLLRVLSLWNAKRLPQQILKQTWFVDALPGRTLDEALAVYENWISGAGHAESVAGRVGPPLLHPLDPRHEYIEEETAWFSSFVEESAHVSVEDLLLAAEESPEYGSDEDRPTDTPDEPAQPRDTP